MPLLFKALFQMFFCTLRTDLLKISLNYSFKLNPGEGNFNPPASPLEFRIPRSVPPCWASNCDFCLCRCAHMLGSEGQPGCRPQDGCPPPWTQDLSLAWSSLMEEVGQLASPGSACLLCSLYHPACIFSRTQGVTLGSPCLQAKHFAA